MKNLFEDQRHINDKCRHFLRFIIDQKNPAKNKRDPQSDHVSKWVCHNNAFRGVPHGQVKTYRQVDFARSRCPKVLKENPLISEDPENACYNIQKALESEEREFSVFNYETGREQVS